MNNNRKETWLFIPCGIFPVIWLALLTAPYLSGGLPEVIRGFPEALDRPFTIRICGDSMKAVLFLDRKSVV